ncbi:hypothetical protein AaE_012781 [Aphanomyces astaci]|uniref:Uncharacterized protein n=1 Tax=Aphanomyces astaci TaxID=112090 RepID=A0A6A4ZF91_APHAT|nr:hypothetical protein AaE_012781 [Aphanomyces astaci]
MRGVAYLTATFVAVASLSSAKRATIEPNKLIQMNHTPDEASSTHPPTTTTVPVQGDDDQPFDQDKYLEDLGFPSEDELDMLFHDAMTAEEEANAETPPPVLIVQAVGNTSAITSISLVAITIVGLLWIS